MSTRLTKDMRETIMNRLVRRALRERQEALKKEELKFGDLIYYHVYPKALRDKMHELPKGFLPTNNSLKINFEGGRRFTWVHFGESRRIAQDHENNCAASIPAGHPLGERHEEIENEREKLKMDKERLERDIIGVLHSVTTLDKLIKVWPEVADQVLDLHQGPSPGLPMVITTELNQLLKLP